VYTQIRAQVLGELGPELSRVVATRSSLSQPLKAAILAIVQSFHGGESCEKTLSQGGGASTSLYGGDERGEPESHFKFPHGVLPSVMNSAPTAENKKR
jgi:hypothetical protein